MESEVNELFSRFGKVQEVRFMMDWQRGRFRGYGFVIMPEEAATRAVRELDGAEFQGRPLRVSLARQRERASA
ncbi:MAG: hypothetical protein JJT96_03075 [Opitutales bacterium]|nr:hypothetical protein [Opitutales bacterium]